MRLFYTLMHFLHSLHLAIALKAPVQNKQHIEALRADVRRWERALEDYDLKERFTH